MIPYRVHSYPLAMLQRKYGSSFTSTFRNIVLLTHFVCQRSFWFFQYVSKFPEIILKFLRIVLIFLPSYHYFSVEYASTGTYLFIKCVTNFENSVQNTVTKMVAEIFLGRKNTVKKKKKEF